MTPEEVTAKLRSIVEEQLGTYPDEVRLESRFVEDLGADSLDIVELVMAIEDEFNIETTDEEVEQLTTFGKALEFIKTRV